MRNSGLIKPFLAGLLILFQLHAESVAQNEKTQEQNNSKVVERYPLISIDAEIVSRSTGTMITDFRHDDFIISENKVRQTVASWQQQPLPLSLLIAVDFAANNVGRAPLADRLAAIKSSLALFLKPQDQVSIMGLMDEPILLLDLTNNKDLIINALDEAARYKETPHLGIGKRLSRAIQEAARHSQRTSSLEARHATIIISDLPERTVSHAILSESVFRTVLESRTTFFWSPSAHLPSHSFDPAMLSLDRISITDLVGATGGTFIDTHWKGFLERLRRRIRIAYWPNTFGRSGDIVRIKLEIKPNPKRDIRDLIITYPGFAIIPQSH